MDEKELLSNLTLLQEQQKILQANLEMLNLQLSELNISKLTLEGIGKLKKGDEILIPIGAGSFVKAKLENTERVIVGVGADVALSRNLEDAISNLEKRVKDISEKLKETQDAFLKVSQKLQELSQEASRILEQRRGTGDVLGEPKA